MSEKKFDISDAISFGWETVTKNIGFFIAVMLTIGAVAILSNVLMWFLKEEPYAIRTIVSLLFWVGQTMIGLGLAKIALKFCDGEEVKFEDLFSCFPMTLNYIAGMFIFGLIVMGGFILLIVPGIIFAIQFQFWFLFIIDKGRGPIESLKMSAEITEGVKPDLFVFGILLSMINFVGFICLFVGSIVTIPLVTLAHVFVFRQLLNYSGSKDTQLA